MTTDVVKYAFIAGEISPTLYGRTDLTKYDLAVAEGHNFFVDYRGGLSSRPGFEFSEFVKTDTQETRMFTFNFSPDLSNSYVVLFGHNYIRFLQDGNYILSSDKIITGITKASVAVVTIAAHGLANNRWIKISDVVGMTQVNGKTFEIRNVTTNTFELYSVPDGVAVNSTAFTTYSSGGIAKPIYEIVSPYAGSDLETLSVFQYRDLMRITSNYFPIYNLKRLDHTDWTLSIELISPILIGPPITSSSDSDNGDAQTIFAVTKVLKDGTESITGNLYKLINMVNYTSTEGSVSIAWSAQADARFYRVYRSVVSQSETLLAGAELGYVGRTSGTKFTDPNTIPDFTRVPPLNSNPFAPGAITDIIITAVGSGYNLFATTISITDPDGSGFIGQVVVSDSGEVVNVIIKCGGSGYTSPVVSFSGGGTGATATATARALTGTYPALSAIFQQRQIYAASLLQPITVWGSCIKQLDNFSSSEFVLADDSFEFNLDTPAIAPIRHMLVTRGGLLVMTQEGIYLLNGGNNNTSLTPTNALAEPQTYNGVSTLKPIPIDSDILFMEGKGHSVRLLSYSEATRIYGSDDKSILSSHLFGVGKTIKRWAYQESPFKVVWSIREDGALLAFTTVKTEEVFAWTPGATKGKFVDLVGIREEADDRIYVTTLRFINNRWTKFIERMNLREFENVEDAWCVDAGLSLGATYPSGTLTIFFNGTDWTASCSVSMFTGKLGNFIRAGQGIFKITNVISATLVALEMFAEPVNWVPEAGNTMTFPVTTGNWTLDKPVTALGGLYHLEGEEVSILGDGNVFSKKTVVNGAVSLDFPVTRAIVGLGFNCRAKTLPMIVPNAGIEAKRKRVVGIGIRLNKSRGIKIGPNLGDMFPMRERTFEAYGHATKMVNGIKYQLLNSEWNEEGQTYFVQEDPLPVTLLSIVSDIEVGDEPD